MALSHHSSAKKFQHQRYDSHGVISPSGTSRTPSPTGAVGEIFSLTNLVVAVVCFFDRRTLFAPTVHCADTFTPHSKKFSVDNVGNIRYNNKERFVRKILTIGVIFMKIMDTIGFVENVDKEVGEAMKAELARQRRNLELIASENIVSPAVMAAMGSVLTNKYAEGYSGKRYYGGCQCVDVVEDIAVERACKLFGAKYANVQPHSGAQANTAVYFALLKPGDTVMGMSLDAGGHLTHGSPVNLSGKYFNFVPYGVNDEGYIDYEALYKQANKCRPRLIVAGASAYPRAIDFAKLSEIAKAVGAYLMVDMAHIAGLVAAGCHQSPVPYADVVTTTTHKTLRGPRGGLILTNNEYIAKKINSAIFPGTQGGPLMHVIAAKAVCFGEALKPEFKAYGEQIVKNAQALAKGLLDRIQPCIRRYRQSPYAC